MAQLPTNFQDDVLDVTQNENRKYNMIQNQDGTVSFEDVTEYVQQGSQYGAQNVNAQNTEINALNSNLTTNDGTNDVPFKFVYDSASGKYGYKDGADTFCPFSSGEVAKAEFRIVYTAQAIDRNTSYTCRIWQNLTLYDGNDNVLASNCGGGGLYTNTTEYRQVAEVNGFFHIETNVNGGTRIYAYTNIKVNGTLVSKNNYSSNFAYQSTVTIVRA